MAKRQQFIAGSTNPITNKALSTEQMNLLWNRLAVLKSDVLNGTFFQQSTYSFDSSNEIANAIERFGIELDDENNSQLADLLESIRNTSLVFKGFVSSTEPDPASYTLVEGNLWINSATMPTTFPVPVADIKVWDGTAWADATEEYTPFTLDIFRDINTNNGYYWLGGQWVIMSTDMSTLYFQLDAAGKWEIKNSIKLPGSPTIETMGTGASAIPTKEYVDTAITDGTAGIGFLPGFMAMWGAATVPTGWLRCDGSSVSKNDYPALFAVLGTKYGGDGNPSFNLPNFSGRVPEGGFWGTRAAGLPNITGYFTLPHLAQPDRVIGSKLFAVTQLGTENFGVNAGGGGTYQFDFNPSKVNSIYGASTTVQPPACGVGFIIKY